MMMKNFVCGGASVGCSALSIAILWRADGNHRVVCLERLEFRAAGTIAPITLT